MATYQFSGVGRIDCCGECPMCNGSITFGEKYYFCELSDLPIEVDNYDSRPSDCPLILVKED